MLPQKVSRLGPGKAWKVSSLSLTIVTAPTNPDRIPGHVTCPFPYLPLPATSLFLPPFLLSQDSALGGLPLVPMLPSPLPSAALSGTRKPTQQVVCAKAGATDLFCQAMSITNSFLNNWLERPPDWLSTTPCCYLGAGQAHCVPGHHRCHHVHQLQVVLALTEIKVTVQSSELAFKPFSSTPMYSGDLLTLKTQTSHFLCHKGFQSSPTHPPLS